MSRNKKEDQTHRDLTRLEDLSEFEHVEDLDLDNKFGDFDSPAKTPSQSSHEEHFDLNENSDLMDESELPPDFNESTLEEIEVSSMNFNEEISEEEISEELPEELKNELDSDDLRENYETLSEASSEDYDENSHEDLEDFLSDDFQAEQGSSHKIEHSSERFEDVKSFAQNFNYGQVLGGGNPPFSLIIRNLKFHEEKEDIISLLSEFGIVTDSNLEETKKALELGSLLISQISEYSAIVLSHKFRRFDCDIEVGLTDEVHPSKTSDANPRGLVKKETLRQNKIENYKKTALETSASEIIIATTPGLEGYNVKRYLGIRTSFAVVDEDELIRLKFVQDQERSQSPTHDYETESNLSTAHAYGDYQNAFDQLFVDLANQLKTTAAKEKANALLGVTYQFSTLPLDKKNQGKNCFQLTCSATLAIVEIE